MGNAETKESKDTKVDDALSSVSEDTVRRESIIKSDEAVRSRFVKGLQYNMKIVLRGERYTGKTSLFKRFQGAGFLRTYTPSPEIQTTTINWNMKNCPDNVRVEVWDVVDKGIVVEQKKAGGPGKHQFGALDSSVLDVYTGCHTAIFVINPFDIKSYEYVESNYKEVPGGTSILILQSFRDQIVKSPDDPEPSSDTLSSKSTDTVNSLQNNEVIIGIKSEKENNEDIKTHRVVVTAEMIEQLVAAIKAHRAAADDAIDASVHTFEISNMNCYGLKELYHYLCIPFLRLKQASLLAQLQTVKSQIQEHDTSLSALITASSYSAFAKAYESKVQEKLEAAKAAASPLPASADNTKDVVVSNTNDSDSSDYELTSMPEVQGDRYEKRKKSSTKSSNSGTLKLSHDGATDSIDNQDVVVKRPSKVKTAKSKAKTDDIQAFRPGGNDSMDKFLDSDDDQQQTSKANAAALSAKNKKKGGFVDIKLRGAPDSDNSEEEEKKVSRPSPLVKKGLTKVGKKKGDSALSSPVNLPPSPVVSLSDLSITNEVTTNALPLEASAVVNTVSDVSVATTIPEESNTSYIEAHWGAEVPEKGVKIKKISSNSSINNELKVKVDSPKSPVNITKAKTDPPSTPPLPMIPANVPRRKRETATVARPMYLADEDDSIDSSVIASKPTGNSKSTVLPTNEIDDFVPNAEYNYEDMSDDNKSSPVLRRSPPHSPLTTTTRTRSIDSADGSGVEEILAVRKEKIKSKRVDKKGKRKPKQEYSESLDL